MKKIAVWMLVMLFVVSTSVMAAQKEWTVMIFINGDNNLEGAGVDDINEMEKVGSTDKVNIVTLFDRAEGYDSSNGNWTHTKIFYVTKDNNGSKINSEVVADWGEVDTGDYKQVVRFVKFCKENYPAKKYLLAVWNHGAGWKKNKDKLGFLKQKGISYDDSSDNHITTPQLGIALKKIHELLGKKLDVFGMDACLMQMIEVGYEVKDHVETIVASEETEPGDGWPYDDFLAPLIANPQMGAEELAAIMVEKYNESYSGGSQGNKSVTQSAIRAPKLSKLAQAINKLGQLMISKESYLGAMKDVISQCQDFYYSEYKDLYHFAKLLKAKVSEDTDLKNACQAVMDILQNEVIVKNATHGSSYSNAYGLAIYIPTKSGYLQRYEELAFAKDVAWEELLKAYWYPPFPIMNIEKVILEDENGDGKYSAGEKITVKIKIKNTGGQPADGVKATLETKDKFVEFIEKEVNIGTVAAAGATTVSPAMIFKIKSTCKPNHVISFKVKVEDSASHKASKEFDIMVRMPFQVTCDTLVIVPDITKEKTAGYIKALEANGKAFDLWDMAVEGKIKKSIIDKYNGGLIIRAWPNYSTGKIDKAEQDALIGFLKAGGKLFISGQDVGYSLKNTSFYKNYLSAKFVNDNTGIHTINCTELVGCLSFKIEGGDGANNQKWPDEIDPVGSAKAIFKYAQEKVKVVKAKRGPKGIKSSGTAGVFVEKDGYKVVYLAFGFEAISTAEDRKAVMGKALKLLKLTLRDELKAFVSATKEEVNEAREEKIVEKITTKLSENDFTAGKELLTFAHELDSENLGKISGIIKKVTEKLLNDFVNKNRNSFEAKKLADELTEVLK